LTFAGDAERVTRSDIGHSRGAIIDRGKIPAERLHPDAACSRCRPVADVQRNVANGRGAERYRS